DGLNVYQFGPAAGSSPGIQFETIVAESGLSGDTNAYRSVLSAVGSCEMSGASRWLDALAASGLPPLVARTAAIAVAGAAARRTNASFFRTSCSFLTARRGSDRPSLSAAHSPAAQVRFGPVPVPGTGTGPLAPCRSGTRPGARHRDPSARAMPVRDTSRCQAQGMSI